MPNSMKLNNSAECAVTSRTPDETGKILRLERKNKTLTTKNQIIVFGNLKKLCTFVVFKTKRTKLQKAKVFFIPEYFLCNYKTVGLPVAPLLYCNGVRLVTNGRLDSLSVFNNL